MIRVNLLPHVRRDAAPESSQAWLGVVMLIIVAEIVGLFFFHQTKEEELSDIQNEVKAIQGQIAEIKTRVKDHKKIKDELEVLRAREDAIAKLLAGRKGPTAVLLEISRILTKGKGPTVDAKKLEKQRQLNPSMVYNAAWDSKRLWLTSFNEAQRNVRLEGVARDAGDVYEFAQRLRLSRYFDNVTLLKGGKQKGSGGVELVSFALRVKVKY